MLDEGSNEAAVRYRAGGVRHQACSPRRSRVKRHQIVGVEGGAPALQGLCDGFRVEARIITKAHDCALVRDGTAWRVDVVEGGREQARKVRCCGAGAET